jgi:GNAT superfamily N-acetyltransferase
MSYRLEAVESSRSAAFDAAYAALDAEFAPRGELERRDVIARWLDQPPASGREGTFVRTYHLLIAHDEAGAFAGVRDCHVVLDPKGGVAIVYLAHALVLPRFRRTGLGALLRSAPLALTRRALADAGMADRPVDVLLAAEMEPASLGDEASVIRLAAYAKDGFSAISPAALPYCQPDFRELRSANEARPIPLLAVVRRLGHEGEATLPLRLARAFVQHLYVVFATHVRADHLAALERRTLGVLDAFVGRGDVPLLALPRADGDPDVAIPISRAAVLSFFPKELR